jgi:outer membrane protein assembly factor BamB
MTTRAIRLALASTAIAVLAGCSTTMQTPSLSSLTSWIPSIPTPSLAWLTGGSKKPGPLPPVKTSATPKILWQASVGKAVPGLSPAVTTSAVYAAATDGSLARIDPANGRIVWKVSTGKHLSAGPGADNSLVVVATDKGDVLAYDADGKPRWTAKVSSQVDAPPIVGDNVAVVISSDGRIYGLDGADGRTKWVDQRTNPPLVVRNSAGGIVSRGGVFIGTAGGRLIALDIDTGTIGWDSAVATPKGSTELERIADITSLPYISEREICAVAYQGRLACFDILRGTLIWSRDVSSIGGLTGDRRNLYVTDDKGAVQALDAANGASLWKQDALAGRHIGGPQLVGIYVGVVDIDGYLHLLSRIDGAYVGRIASDGKNPTTQPAMLAEGAAWQSEGGNVIAVTAQ